MNQKKPSTDFEQRLLVQLRAVVAERALPRCPGRGPGGHRLARARAFRLRRRNRDCRLARGHPRPLLRPDRQPAAAEVLHETAEVAVSPGGTGGLAAARTRAVLLPKVQAARTAELDPRRLDDGRG